MRELVFLLEEESVKALLQTLLPRLLAPGTNFRLIPFEGKQDLEKQLVRKIRGYQNEQARFIVLRDQDSHPDCKQLKARLVELCQQTGKADQCLVRVACQELETFYLADLQAVAQALDLPDLARHQGSRKFRTPDALGNPSQELKTLTRNRYQKVSGSRLIGQHLSLDNQRSASFHHLLAAIRRWETALAS